MLILSSWVFFHIYLPAQLVSKLAQSSCDHLHAGLLGKEHAEQCPLKIQDPQALRRESTGCGPLGRSFTMFLMNQSVATMKRMGERMHPWGTPQMMENQSFKVVNKDGKFNFPLEAANKSLAVGDAMRGLSKCCF